MKKVLKMLSAVLSAVMLFTVIFSVPVAAVTDAQSVNSKRLAYFNNFAVDLLSGTIPDSVPANVIEDIKAAQDNADKVLSNAGSTQEQTDSACAELEEALLEFDHNVYYFDLPPYTIAKGAFDAVTSYFNTLDCNADYIINIPLDYEYAQHVILPAYFGVQIPQLLDLNIGGYNFKANTNYYPSDLGYIVYNYMTGDTYTLEYAFENNIISVKLFYDYYTLNKDTESFHFTMSPLNSEPVNDLTYAKKRAQGFVQAYNDKISEEIPGGGYKLGEFSDYKYGQYLLIQAENLMPPPMKLSTRIDGYLIESDKADMGFLAVNYITGKVMPLEIALEQGLIDIDDFYSFYQSQNYESDDMKFVMCVIGDCDYDSELTIKDATLIQKGIVGFASIDSLKVTVLERDNQADVNYDGEIDVADATQIQKMIVGLE